MSVLRREFALVLLVGAAGAGLVVLALRRPWAQAIFTAPRPLPAQDFSVTGQAARPAGERAGARGAGLPGRRDRDQGRGPARRRRLAGCPRRGCGGRRDRRGERLGRALRGQGERLGWRSRRVDDQRHLTRRCRRTRSSSRVRRPCGHGWRALARGGRLRCRRDRAGRPGHRLAGPALAGHVGQVRAPGPQTTRGRPPAPGRQAVPARAAAGRRDRGRFGDDVGVAEPGHRPDSTADRPGATDQRRSMAGPVDADIGTAGRARAGSG